MKIEKIIRSKDYDLFNDYLDKRKIINIDTILKLISKHLDDNTGIFFIIKIIEYNSQFEINNKIKKLKKYSTELPSCIDLLKYLYQKNEYETKIRDFTKFFVKDTDNLDEIMNIMKNEIIPVLKSFIDKKFNEHLTSSFNIIENDKYDSKGLYKNEIIERLIQFKSIFGEEVINMMNIEMMKYNDFIQLEYIKQVDYFLNFTERIEVSLNKIKTNCIFFKDVAIKIINRINKLKNNDDSDTESFISDYIFDSEDINDYEPINDDFVHLHLLNDNYDTNKEFEKFNTYNKTAQYEKYDTYDEDIDIKRLSIKLDQVYKEKEFDIRTFMHNYTNIIINNLLQKKN